MDDDDVEKESVKVRKPAPKKRASRERSRDQMAATLRELRGRIRSAGSIKKITKAQELIATSRIAKAQARVAGGPAVRRRDHQHAHRPRERQRAGSPAARRAGEPEAGGGPGGVLGPRPVRCATTPTCCGRPRSSSRCCAKRARSRWSTSSAERRWATTGSAAAT